jgi:hypothetical protein
MKKIFFPCLLMFSIVTLLPAETWMVSTLCGANDNGHQIDGSKDKACFTDKVGHIAADPQGNLFVVDQDALRKVLPDGTVQSWLGGLISDTNGNRVEIPKLNNLKGVCITKEGTLFVTAQNSIQQINSNKDIILYAGTPGTQGSDDGTGTAAEFDNPYGLCADKAGNIYVADADNRSIRKIAVGTKAVTTLAGGTRDGSFKAGTGRSAMFFPFRSITVDSKGNLYVPQNGNRGSGIAKITATGVVTLLAGDLEYLGKPNDGTGKNAHFDKIYSVATDAQDNIIVGEQYRVRKISPAGVVTTLAGGPEPQWKDAVGEKARFGMIGGVTVNAQGEIYTSDLYCIRKLVKQ